MLLSHSFKPGTGILRFAFGTVFGASALILAARALTFARSSFWNFAVSALELARIGKQARSHRVPLLEFVACLPLHARPLVRQ